MVGEAQKGMPPGVEGADTSGEGGNVAKPDDAAAATAAAEADAAKTASAAPDDGKGTAAAAAAAGIAHPDSALPNDGGEWFAGMPEELHGVAGKFDSPEALAVGYQNLESATGTSIRIPGEDAGPEDRQAFLTKLTKAAPELMMKPDLEGDNKHDVMRTLGMPENADGYQLPAVEGVDAKALAEEMAPLRAIALDAGLTNDQYVAVAHSMLGANHAQNDAAQAAFAKDVAQLKNDWGDAYGDRYRAAADIAKKTGAPEMIQNLFKDGAVNTDTIRWMYDLHKAFGSESSELTLQPGGALIDSSPDDAKAKLAEIYNNKQHAYWISSHPDNKAAIQTVVKLQKQADPSLSDDPNLLRSGRIPGFAQ